MIGFITLLTGTISISTVAAFYSIVGLISIFNAAMQIAIMGIGVLEVGKLVKNILIYIKIIKTNLLILH